MRTRLVLAACCLVAAVGTSSAALAQDGKPPDVDCSIKPKRTYSLTALLRNRGVTIPTRCDGATRALLTFEVTAPLEAALETPSNGRPDADGDVSFAQAGTKRVRLRLHKKTARAIRGFRRIKVAFHVSVELPDEPGWYYGDPRDARKAVFRRG